jgi:D-alanyl-lipoteichoic acid acyltransferase DltB (MBOAT superfamily)
MSFASYSFLIFLPCVFVLYWLLKKREWQTFILLAASYIFYGWVTPSLAALLGTSTLLDFILARGMVAKPERKRLFMLLSLILNLGVLALFKYYNFFNDDFAGFITSLGMNGDFFLTRILLPAGLSFYTLKKLGYMIDVSRGTLKPTHTLLDFALYVSFFPQLLAGPIERPQKLLPQIEAQRTWKAEFFYGAWPLIVMGFFKKIVIADNIKIISDQIFSLSEPSIFLLVMGTLAFTLQILADFSGYTDMSRGFALLFGFQTSENFNLPYASLTPTDFWNRWHITLSNWLRDYIFFPVGRSLKKSRIKLPQWLVLSIPPIATMFVSGLWHGAGWNFVLWGLYYGVLISAYQWIGIRGDWKPRSAFMRGVAWLIMFSFIVIGWSMFRAPSMAWLGNILFHMPFLRSQDDLIVGLIALSMTIVYSIPLLIKLGLDRYEKDGWLLPAYYAFATVLIIVFLNATSPDFIYNQF